MPIKNWANSYICGCICSGCKYFGTRLCIKQGKKYCRNRYAYAKLMGMTCPKCGIGDGICNTLIIDRLGREYVQ